MKNVRALAARVLLDAERMFVDEALEAHRTAALSRRDRSFLTALVYGVARRRRALDWLIDRCAARVHPEIRQHLRVALFQIRYMTRVPRHAAVDEAVEAAKAVGHKAAGFVNAVLRKAADLPWPDNRGILSSHPDWLIERWKRFPNLDAILEADNAVLPVTARVNALKTTRDELCHKLNAKPGACEDSIEIEGDPASLAEFTEGFFTVQDETAMAVAPLLAPQPGERVLDLCAAPGGKTTHLAELMAGKGVVVAVDLPDRIGLVRESARRLGLANMECVGADGASVEFREPFDAILIDAPCSNTGVLARRPDARWRIREADIAGAVVIQKRLLDHAAPLLKPGGRLVYSTCSLEPEENRVDLPGFELVREELMTPSLRASGGYMALVRRTS